MAAERAALDGKERKTFEQLSLEEEAENTGADSGEDPVGWQEQLRGRQEMWGVQWVI